MAYSRQEYKKFRVRTPIKSFRDLEVYRQTIQLNAGIFELLEQAKKEKDLKNLIDEFKILYNLSKHIPRLIAEAYGDRFSNFTLGIAKLEQAMRVIADIVTKIDQIVACLNIQELKQALNDSSQKYQKQRVKINNLRRAWDRVRQEKGEYQAKGQNYQPKDKK